MKYMRTPQIVDAEQFISTGSHIGIKRAWFDHGMLRALADGPGEVNV